MLAEARFWLGRALEDYRGDGSRGAYEEAIRIKLDYAEAHCYLGTLLARRGDSRTGEKHLVAPFVAAREVALLVCHVLDLGSDCPATGTAAVAFGCSIRPTFPS